MIDFFTFSPPMNLQNDHKVAVFVNFIFAVMYFKC